MTYKLFHLETLVATFHRGSNREAAVMANGVVRALRTYTKKENLNQPKKANFTLRKAPVAGRKSSWVGEELRAERRAMMAAHTPFGVIKNNGGYTMSSTKHEKVNITNLDAMSFLGKDDDGDGMYCRRSKGTCKACRYSNRIPEYYCIGCRFLHYDIRKNWPYAQ